MREIACAVLLIVVAACSSSSADPAKDAGATDDGGGLGTPDTGQPAGCLESDLDRDGFGTNAQCDRRDCDDGNLNIYPGAFEACNAIDDDCDEAIDEDLGEGTCGEGPCARTVPYC